jgi:transcription-repair coupling factor (superfamily II helicase)
VGLPGTVSRRGGIVDIYSPNSDLPARIELSGDEVESIRLFDPTTQRSLELVSQITIIPAREMAASFNELRDIVRQFDHSTLNSKAKEMAEEELECLARGQWFDGLDFYTSLANDGAFLDYFPEHALVVLDQPDLIEGTLTDLDIQAIELSEALRKQGELPIDFPVPCFTWSELATRLDRFDHRLALEQWGDESECCFMGFSPTPSYGGRVSAFLEDTRGIIEGGCRVIIVSQQAARLSELLGECGIIIAGHRCC